MYLNIEHIYFFRNEIAAGRKAGKCIVVAGCVSQGAPKSEFLIGLSIIGVQQIDRVVEVVEESLKGKNIYSYPLMNISFYVMYSVSKQTPSQNYSIYYFEDLAM